VSNVVFMGMGEPLANDQAVWPAVQRLHGALGLSARHLTLSTVGIVPGIRRLAERPLPVNLAVSLHAANDRSRDELVPINKRYPLGELMEACTDYLLASGRRLSFEWALIDGVNDRRSDARELAELARALPLHAHVNLIPLNPTPGWPTRGTPASAVRAFRDWLQAAGPYAGKGGPGVPDLSAYRRATPLTLADVNALAGRTWKHWSDVDPPRRFPREGRPFWEDPWTHEWELFRRHTVDLHYDELSHWLAEAGVPAARIFSSQGFMGPHPAAMPFSVRLASPSKNYDTGGMSVEGAIPKYGHLGAIVYGPGAQNDIRMETPDSLFATFHRMDPGWAVVEFNTADLRDPKALPTYAAGYRALTEMFNYGARLVSPMAWNGSNGLAASEPGYVSYTAWRNTPLEDALKDFAVAHAYVPLGARLWTFGTPRVASTDGWGADAGTTLAAGNGYLDLRAAGQQITLVSPARLAVKSAETDLLVLGVDASAAFTGVRVEARAAAGPWLGLGSVREVGALERSAAGLLLPLAWPAALAAAEQFRLTFELADGAAPLRVRHVALYPRAGGANPTR